MSSLRLRFFKMQAWQRTLFIMFFAQLCTAVGFSIIFPFLPLYVEDLGTNTSLSIEFWAGMVFSAQGITMMFASPFWGALADRYGRKLMVQRAAFGGMIVIFLMGFARSAEELVLLRAVQGLITGTVAAANALIAASVPRKHMGFSMGMLQVGLWAGVAVGPLIGGVLADAYGFRMPFIITAFMLGLSGVMVMFGVHEDFVPNEKQIQQKAKYWKNWQHIFAMNGVTPTYLIRFLSGLSRSMIVPITPLFVAALLWDMQGSAVSVVQMYPIPVHAMDLLAHVGGVSSITGIVVGIASATATVSAVVLGRLGDRIGHRQILIGSSIFAIVCYLPQAFVTSPLQLIILQAFTGIATGGIVAAPSALLAQYTEPGEEGAVYGLDNSVVAAARAVAPLLGAMIAAIFGLRATFGAMGILFVVIVITSLVILPTPKSEPEAVEVEHLNMRPVHVK